MIYMHRAVDLPCNLNLRILCAVRRVFAVEHFGSPWLCKVNRTLRSIIWCSIVFAHMVLKNGTYDFIRVGHSHVHQRHCS
jgi:hypothetical protein